MGQTLCGCGSVSHQSGGQISLGIYEKALPHTDDWDEFFAGVRQAGFDFVDLSIDETAERQSRLHWPTAERRRVRDAAARHGVQLGGICLSVHRAIGPGSADPAVREQAAHIFEDAIWLAHDLGIPVVQVAGYYAFYEDSDPGQRERYVATLTQATTIAARAGVMLGIENVDGQDVTSISIAKEIADEVGSPWLQIYPDIGNLAEQQLDTVAELAAGQGRMVALHIKDVRVGEPRRVPLGEGIAEFSAAFSELARQRWSGRIMVEMWNDDAPDSLQRCSDARALVSTWLANAGLLATPAS
ncbi:xylulose 5-phosphate 3-epimerase [Bowdeniella nasicola]|uniref:Xylulose 5-phosphate 3-epimerase n=2 Tax=Bowdeniella nasicola TaxID=208480 RepID=A0A1Q5PZI9_9ACTO|nr:xylulose 5-phosphate 3-epimerase [Bowdeniella nasicola]